MDGRHLRRWTLALAAAANLLGAGCASLYPSDGPRADRMVQVPGMSVGEIQEMLRAGRPQAEIVAALRSRGTDAAPTAGDLEALRQSGASAELVDALASAPVVTATVMVPAGPAWAGDAVYGAYPGYYGDPGYYGVYPGYGAVAPAVGASAWWYSTRPSWGPSYGRPYGVPRPYGGVPYHRAPYGGAGSAGHPGAPGVRPPIGSPGIAAPVKPPAGIAPPSSGVQGGSGGSFGRPWSGVHPSAPAGTPPRPFKPSPGAHGRP